MYWVMQDAYHQPHHPLRRQDHKPMTPVGHLSSAGVAAGAACLKLRTLGGPQRLPIVRPHMIHGQNSLQGSYLGVMWDRGLLALCTEF